MQITMLIISTIAILIGILFIFFPNRLVKLAKEANTVIFNDFYFIKHSVPTGTTLIIVGICLLAIYVTF